MYYVKILILYLNKVKQRAGPRPLGLLRSPNYILFYWSYQIKWGPHNKHNIFWI